MDKRTRDDTRGWVDIVTRAGRRMSGRERAMLGKRLRLQHLAHIVIYFDQESKKVELLYIIYNG